MDATNDLDLFDDTEQDVSESHSKLIDAVLQLDKRQRVKKAERSEPALEVSEFHLVKHGVSENDPIRTEDLVKALGRKSHHLDISRSLRLTKTNAQVLPKPLEKPTADKIKRIVGFVNTKAELRKWNAIISKNRTADSLNFPLNDTFVQREPTTEFVNRFRIQSELEKKLAALEPRKENIQQKNDNFSLTLKEIMMKRKEIARIRAQQSYREAKARRQNKIKSKQYHRIQRKDKMKLQLKEFEQLQKTDPAAALEKLEELDKVRAEERMSLRHKNTGQWAKSKLVRAKYDKDTRLELAQQLSVSRELTQKLRKPSDSEDDDVDDDVVPFNSQPNDKENPWIGNSKTESEIDNFVTSYRKYWDNPKNQSNNRNVNVSTKIEPPAILVQSSENTETPITPKDQNVSINIASCTEVKENQKSSDTMKFRKEKTLQQRSQVPSSGKGNDSCKVQLPKSKVLSKKLEARKYNSNPSNRVERNLIPKKTNRIVQALRTEKADTMNVTSTSPWNVEAIPIDIDASIKSLSSDIPAEEKINEIFDFMDKKIQSKLKSKLRQINENSPTIKKKRNTTAKNEENYFEGLEIPNKRQRPILDSNLNESVNEMSMDLNPEELSIHEETREDNVLSTSLVNKAEAEIDPQKYINVKPRQLNTKLPNDISGGDDALDDVDEDDDDDKRNIVSEAFADDDVVECFRKEKQEEIKKSQSTTEDFSLPGWGHWGGKNIKAPNRRRKRFISKLPVEKPRKDENKGDVIIFDDGNPKLKEHQVSELPYPFTAVKDFEASVRMPLGRNFVPENSHRKLIEPVVKTRIGKIIEPMSEDVLITKDKAELPKFIPKSKKKFSNKPGKQRKARK